MLGIAREMTVNKVIAIPKVTLERGLVTLVGKGTFLDVRKERRYCSSTFSKVVSASRS